MNKVTHRTGCLFLVVAATLSTALRPTLAQSAGLMQDTGLTGMIPKEAIFYVERRGHEAVREAFLASNLGKMASDDAIKQFVHDSRVNIGKMIVRSLFDLEGAEEIARYQQLLHEFLLPFWYKPSAMFVITDDKLETSPGLGFICLTGKYAKGTSDALEALMKVGVPPAGRPGFRQTFTHKSGAVTWRGVAKRSTKFTLSSGPTTKPNEQIGEDDSLFMVHWVGHVLCVATDLRAADALGRTLTAADKKITGKIGRKSLQVVLKKTALKDWAFRWYFDIETMMKVLRQKMSDEDAQRAFRAMGIDKMLGIGGTGGYADGVYTRMTYVYAPQADRGLVRIFKPGGSYKQAFAMTPSESTFSLAGQLDTKVLVKMITDMIPKEESPSGEKKINEEAAKIVEQIKALAEASDGNVSLFVTELQALMGMMMASGGPPVGAVLGIKDHDKATKAIDELVKLAGGDEENENKNEKVDDGDVQPPEAAVPTLLKQYRKVPIRYVGEMVRIAIMKDRAVLALSDNALKSAIDTALDKTGGFEPDSKGEKLQKLVGDGSAIFVMDLPAITKLFWPMLMQFSQQTPEEAFFPFVSLPSTNKLVRMLGPEIAVFEPDRDGLLMKSRGKIPFATKFLLLYPAFGLLMMF